VEKESTEKKKSGFTLIEVIVALASSSVILGGFLIAFSSLNKVSRQATEELDSYTASQTAQMTINKLLSNADIVGFNSRVTSTCPDCGTDEFNVLYYYKYDSDSPLGDQSLQEYGFFYVDKQQDTDSVYDASAAGVTGADTNLYYQRCLSPNGCIDSTGGVYPENSESAGANPATFDYRSADRNLLAANVLDFMADVSRVVGEEGSSLVQKFNVEYQIMSAYEHDGVIAGSTTQPEQRILASKGGAYVIGRVTS
jgi:prepilin-type N-terminal cleavage/methylation domain-containing protein